ncbi:MAG: hypothetical protein LBJ10_10565, partial [Clostridiales bacterium]|nr:hypothetical protein [Clostridiales bacterium]
DVYGNTYYTPETGGLWARNYYEYGDYENKSAIEIRDGYAAEDTYGRPALTVLGRNANERIRFGVLPEIKEKAWYDPNGTFLTISFTYFDYDGSEIEEGYFGNAEIGVTPVGGMWNYNYPQRSWNRDLALAGDNTWKTYTATVFAQAGGYDECIFTLELKGNRVLPISYVAVSPATEEEIAAAALPIGLEVDEAESKTQYEVGDALQYNVALEDNAAGDDLKVYLVYSDGYRELYQKQWDWLGDNYYVDGFDSSEEGVLTLTVRNARTPDSPQYWTTVDVTIGDGVPDVPVDKTALEGKIAEAKGYNPEFYTPASADALAAAIALAESVYDDDGATQDAVDDAAQELADAIAGLVVPADKSALEALADRAGYVNAGIFEESAAAAFAGARQAAQELLDDENAGQADADAAYEALDGALGNLSAQELAEDYEAYEELVKLLLEAASLDSSLYEAGAWADFMAVVSGAWDFVAEGTLVPESEPESEGAVLEAYALLAASVEAGLAGAETAAEAEAETAAEATAAEAAAETDAAAAPGQAETGGAAAEGQAEEWQGEILAQPEAVLEPLMDKSDPKLIEWIRRIKEAQDELKKHPAGGPSVDLNIFSGVYARSESISGIEEYFDDDGLAVEFEIRGTGFEGIGTAAVQLSYRVADFEELEVDALGYVVAPYETFGAPAGASITAKKADTPEGVGEDGEYATYVVFIQASGDSLITVAPNEPLLSVKLEAKENKSKRAELLLNMLDAAYYSDEGGPFHANEKIITAYASTLLDISSRFDANGDGKITLLDIELVRKNLGASADADTGEWDSEEARRCDVAGYWDDEKGREIGDGEVDTVDLTVFIAKYVSLL